MSFSLAAPLFRSSPAAALKITESLVRARAFWSSKHRREVEQTELSLRAVGMYSQGLVDALARLPSELAAEGRLLRYGTVDHLRSIQGEASGIGLSPVREAYAQGSGLILGCTHIGNFYHALIQIKRLSDEVLVVSGNQNYSPRTVERLSELSGARIRLVVASTSSTLTIARHLRRGGVAATMLDLYVDSTLALPAPLFGRPAATPAGIYQLAIAADAPIVPVCVTADSAGRKSVEIDSVIEPLDTPLEYATAVNRRIEAMVRRHAARWGAWPTLMYRWRKAQTHLGKTPKN